MFKNPLVLAGVFATLSVGGAYAATPAVTSDAANLRSGPSTHSHVVESVPADARISVQSCSGRWCKVKVNGESGYIARGLIAFNDDSGPGVDNAPVVTQSYIAPSYVYPDEAYTYEDSYPGDYAFGGYGYDGYGHRGYGGAHRGFHGGGHGGGGFHGGGGGFHGGGGSHGGGGAVMRR